MRSRIPFIVATSWLIIVTILLCLPGSEFPKINWMNKIWFDKWVHIGLFLVLTVCWCWYFKIAVKSNDQLKRIFRLVMFLCIVYGALMELIQHYFIPFRSYDFGDIIADAFGALGGFLFAVRTYIKK